MSRADPLNICMITTFYPPYHFGGDALYVYRLAEALASRGHRIDVIHSRDAYRIGASGDPDIRFDHHPNIRVHPLESANPRLATLTSHQTGGLGVYRGAFERVLEARTYDAIHYHNVSLMGAPKVLELGQGIKLYTAHEYWLVCPTHILFRFSREACTKRTCLRCTLYSRRPPQLWRATGRLEKALESIDCMIMSSEAALERHRALGITRPMVLIPPFVSIPEALGPSGGRAARPYFVCAGRLEKEKGIHDAIEAARDFSHADLVIAGEGSCGSQLRAQAAGLNHVRFVGNCNASQLAEYYRNATALISASLCYETFGLTAAEAMAHGTPVIIRRLGALARPVERSGSGLVFEDVNGCRRAMKRLASDADLRLSMGKCAREFAERFFGVDAHVDRYLDLIAGLKSARTRSVQASVPERPQGI